VSPGDPIIVGIELACTVASGRCDVLNVGNEICKEWTGCKQREAF